MPSTLYHGTTTFWWKRNPKDQPLFVTGNKKFAIECARDQRQNDKDNRRSSKPLLIEIPFRDISRLELIPDEAVTSTPKWTTSFSRFGSFAAVGVSGRMKSQWKATILPENPEARDE